MLEDKWSLFEEDLKITKNIDDIMEKQEKFINECLKECLLTDQIILKKVIKTMTTCTVFSISMLKLHKTMISDRCLQG